MESLEPQDRGRAGMQPGYLTRFKKGQSGNPGGMPKGLARMVRDMSNDGEEMVLLLFEIMRGKMSVSARRTTIDQDGNASSSEVEPTIKERMEAAKILLDRGFGKALETVELTGNGKSPLEGLSADALLKLAKID